MLRTRPCLHPLKSWKRNPTLYPKQSTHPLSTSSLSIPLLSTLPTPLIPPLIFLTLLISLWTWKCLWIIILQDKLLYLSWLPPFSRSDRIDEYQGECRGVTWVEKTIRSGDGTKLVVCEGEVDSVPTRKSIGSAEVGKMTKRTRKRTRKRVVVAYFQGNGGSTPMRLPLLSGVLRGIQEVEDTDVEYILAALSYRGYWKSSGRATQRGIELDAQSFLSWVRETYAAPDTDLSVVLWGHSLGAAVASSAVAKALSEGSAKSMITGGGKDRESTTLPITGLVLEAPISSIKDMLISLYPQKWLPYRYLWPFSWNKWDVEASLREMAGYKAAANGGSDNGAVTSRDSSIPPIFLMSAEADEVIPLWVADRLEDTARSSGLEIQRLNVKGAMHIEGPLKVEGRRTLIDFIRRNGSR
ncbi:Alpha/Beta hydrolase protein [Aspergillus karnatakaensis]|uniref:alpha/beta hydrolase family protein n=1 Tax=Aspergillus karnatakaensis TaxID=1810916 RepID=UPI003CCE134D